VAKITARGDREVARWQATGRGTLVYTQSGRILRKPSGGHGGYTLLRRAGATRDQAAELARALGLREATPR
jgi:hypothetical protein